MKLNKFGDPTKYPIDFIVQDYPFSDEDLEIILQFSPEDLAYFIDTLKQREVNYSLAKQEMTDKLELIISGIKETQKSFIIPKSISFLFKNLILDLEKTLDYRTWK